MNKKNGIYWLASYPKSGNTWFRIVLSNLLNKTEEMTNLDNINTGAIASSRAWIDNVLGFNSASLTHQELDSLLPDVYTYQHQHATDIGYHKIHNAYTYLDKQNKIPLIPASSCHGVIYIIRNPLDVAISLANHNSCSVDAAINMMGAQQHAYSGSIIEQAHQIRHRLCSWSEHVESWQNAPKLNLLTIRYEDMKTDPLDTFSRAMRFLTISFTEDAIRRAIDNASMEKLKHIEKTKGFKERPAKVATFFRKGTIDDWKENLSAEQIRKIIKQHAAVMHQFEYLDEALIDYF